MSLRKRPIVAARYAPTTTGDQLASWKTRRWGCSGCRSLAGDRGWSIARDGPYFRRVVASPAPKAIVELDSIKRLLASGVVVVCAARRRARGGETRAGHGRALRGARLGHCVGDVGQGVDPEPARPLGLCSRLDGTENRCFGSRIRRDFSVSALRIARRTRKRAYVSKSVPRPAS